MAVSKGDVSRRERRIKEREERDAQVRDQRKRFTRRERSKRILNYTILAAVVIGVAALIYAFAREDGPGEHDALARCLTEKGVIMYGTDWCPHCQEQKQRFGSSFRYVNYINCDLNAQACELAGVQGYPTWVFPQGPSVAGEQELATLAARAECTDAAS